jgi:hypothetical protein
MHDVSLVGGTMRRWAAVLLCLGLFTSACGSNCGKEAVPPDPVRDFVQPTYAHGVPYDRARALGPSAEPILMQMLDEQAMAPHRNNIIVTLGILGSPTAAQRAIATIEAGTGPLPSDEVSLRMDAVMALGYAAYDGASPAPLAYVIGGLDAAAWAPRVKWQLTSGADPADQLRARSIAAAGLSGKPAALLALQNLLAVVKGGGGRGGGGGSSAGEQALITEAIAANQFIAANGMSKYYQTSAR